MQNPVPVRMYTRNLFIGFLSFLFKQWRSHVLQSLNWINANTHAANRTLRGSRLNKSRIQFNLFLDPYLDFC